MNREKEQHDLAGIADDISTVLDYILSQTPESWTYQVRQNKETLEISAETRWSNIGILIHTSQPKIGFSVQIDGGSSKSLEVFSSTVNEEFQKAIFSPKDVLSVLHGIIENNCKK